MRDLNISVLGDGGWGTTLAILLNNKGYKVTLWSAFEDYAIYLNKKRVNSKFLPAVKIPRNIEITHDLAQAVKYKELIVLAIPSQHLRRVLKKIRDHDYKSCPRFLSVVKGIETKTLKRMSEVIHEELGRIKLAVLSGPTIAHEVARGIPTTAVAASYDRATMKSIQNIFMTERFRVYTNSDVIGVELGGSFKNVIAIACGISDGLGFGSNTKSALLARGIVEISRLGHVMGARLQTFSGISGLGDLATTCMSPYSRNRFVGEQIGKGRVLREITKRMQMPACRQAGVAEGVPTAKSAYALSLKHKVSMPITKEVYSVLYKNKSPLKAVRDLMTREGKAE
ncbi:MAG: glycerol-3-phosphate dehydrogenase [Candidatus Omnitrophota bacterium]|nr:MAG: glycerol-3-phosphate dehydrogenase [Candidatus Omnitrophota bacterium]